MRASLAPPGRARGKPAVAHRSPARAPSKQSSKMALLSTPSRWKLVVVTGNHAPALHKISSTPAGDERRGST